jgi:hypothetical protein
VKGSKASMLKTLQLSGNSVQLAKSGTKTPSKHVPLKRLQQIKQDNNVGENGTDYSEQELNDAIVDRKVSGANKMVSAASNKEKKMAQDAQNSKAPSFPPPMPMKKGANGDWGKDPNYTFHHIDMPDSDELVGHHQVEVRHKNKPIASLRYFRQADFGDDEAPYLTSGQTTVSPKHRRKGLGSAMYNYAEKIHKLKMRPSSDQTPAAQALWANPNRTFGKSITFNIHDPESEVLQKSAPVQENEQHPSKPWVSKYHPNGMLMWHASPSQANKIDNTIQNPKLVQDFLNNIPEHHQENVKKVINHVLSDPNRHFVPSEDNGKQKLRARHIRDLLLGGNGVNINTEDPNNLKITRESHSQVANYKPIVFNFRNGANNGSPKANDRSGTSGPVQDLHVRNGSPSGLQPRGSGLRNEQSGGSSPDQSNNPARRIGDTKQIEPKAPPEKVSSGVMVRRAPIKKSITLDQYLGLKSLLKSENDVILNSMEKGIASKVALAGMIGASSLFPSKTTQSNVQNPPKIEQKQGLDKQRALRAIAMVESHNGKYTRHEPTSLGTAHGFYGLMPNTIKETIAKNPSLKDHRIALDMNEGDLHRYMDKNPKLEHQVAAAHYDRLHSKFGDDLATIGYSWLAGLSGGIKAKQQGKDLSQHWHAAKVLNAYGKP